MKLVLQITLGILLAVLVLYFIAGFVNGATSDRLGAIDEELPKAKVELLPSTDAMEARTAIIASFDGTGIKATVNADKLVLQATQHGLRSDVAPYPRATCAEFASRLLAEHSVRLRVARLTTVRMYHGYATDNLQWVDCPIWP